MWWIRIVPAVALLLGACSSRPPQAPAAQPRFSVDGAQPSGGSATISGEVLGVDNREAADETKRTLSLQISQGGKPPVTVQLGPGWYFTKRGIEFRMNDQVVIAGEPVHVHGEDVIVAHEVRHGGTIYIRPAGDPLADWQVGSPIGGGTAPAGTGTAPAGTGTAPAGTAPAGTAPSPPSSAEPAAPETPAQDAASGDGKAPDGASNPPAGSAKPAAQP